MSATVKPGAPITLEDLAKEDRERAATQTVRKRNRAIRKGC